MKSTHLIRSNAIISARWSVSWIWRTYTECTSTGLTNRILFTMWSRLIRPSWRSRSLNNPLKGRFYLSWLLLFVSTCLKVMKRSRLSSMLKRLRWTWSLWILLIMGILVNSMSVLVLIITMGTAVRSMRMNARFRFTRDLNIRRKSKSKVILNFPVS